jgi:Uma2 family endonuclease
MATIISDRTYTPEDLLTMPDGDRFELVNGQLVESEMSGLATFIAMVIGSELWRFVKDRQLGVVFASEAQYRCFPDDSARIRKPDVSFIHRGRVTEGIMTGFIPIPPDLAIEVVSPHDTYYEVEEKVIEYLAAGVRLVWVVNPNTKTIRVHRPESASYEVVVGDELAGDDVLPEFRVAVAEIFAPPASDASEQPT